MKKFSTLLTAGLVVGLCLSGGAIAQDLNLTVIGSLKNVSSYEDFEKKFFNETLPEVSGGTIKADLKSITEMGLKGPEVLRLVANGVAPLGSILIGYNTGDDAAFEAVDIAGLAPDVETARELTEASFPFYDQHLGKHFGVKLLALGTNPGQVFWCNGAVESIKDLSGKKVRVNGKGPAELVEAVGGTSVFMSFAEVIPALQNNTVDCMVGGTLPVNMAGIADVTTHVLSTAVGWGQIAYIANLDFWNGLTPEQQALLAAETKKALQDEMWDAIPDQTEQGLLCAGGSDDCRIGKKANMTVVPSTDEEREFLREVFETKLLPAWADRCSAECVELFNQTIGAAAGIEAVK